MSDRTAIAVVSELRKSGLTVEQQMLVDELVLLIACLQSKAEVRKRWRENKRVQRQSEDKRKEPKENNILNNNIPGEKGAGKNPRTVNANPRALGTNPRGFREEWELGFERFYNQYPRKRAKGAARKAYRNALKRATADEIEAGAVRYAAEMRNKDPEFIAHAASWLNADRWLDEPNNVIAYQRPIGPKRTWAEIKAERDAR